MSTTTDTDLTRCTDAELDAALRIGYRKHRDANTEDRLEHHLAIQAIVAEQARRLDLWLTRQASA